MKIDGKEFEASDVKLQFTSELSKDNWVTFTDRDFKMLALCVAFVLSVRGEWRPTLRPEEFSTEDLSGLEDRCIKAADILEKYK